MKVLSRLPWFVLYAIAYLSYLIGYYLVRHRRAIIEDQLQKVFPEKSQAERTVIHKQYLKNFTQVFAEILKMPTISEADLKKRVKVNNFEVAHKYLNAGKSVLFVTSHLGNWEWLLQGVYLQLGFPVDAAYKPLHDAWAEKLMYQVRTRFGARLIPAKELLGDFLKRRGVVRGVAMNADQAPVSTDNRYWTTFLGQDTAFYIGAEQIARGIRLPMIYTAMRRIGTSRYEVDMIELWDGKEVTEPNTLTERYARASEKEVRQHPADWLWSYRRWRLKKPLYGQE
jgi:KDO2-lipid IV(A) lauroyltransferase